MRANDVELILDMIEQSQDFIIKNKKIWSESHDKDVDENILDRCNYGKVIAAQKILEEINKLHLHIYNLSKNQIADVSKMVKLEKIEGIIINVGLSKKQITPIELIEIIRNEVDDES